MANEIELLKGTIIRSEGQEFEILGAFDLESIVAIHTMTKERKLIAIRSIEFPSSAQPVLADRSLTSISDKQWNKGLQRLEVVKELLSRPDRTRADAEKIASGMGVHPSTLYKWAKKFQKTGTLDSLVSEPRERNDRLPEAVEKILERHIKEKYLTSQRNSIHTVWKHVDKECKALGLRTPHANTLAKRIRKLEPKAVVLAREGADAANRFNPTPGTSPDKAWPGNTYQIDHTPLDICIVDSVYRKPIGRGWVTVAIDTNCRVVPGFCVSIDAPSTESVSETIRLCLIRKDEWLAARNLDWKWNIWGKPAAFHADNAAEFHSAALDRAVRNQVMDLIWRPGGKKNYGAYIERYLGTLNRRLHELPGTTFRNPQHRGDYDSEGFACMTIDEVEIWLAHIILGEYHNSPHSGLNKMSPMQAYEAGILGTSETKGKGIPAVPTNLRKLYLDFLPRDSRVVHSYGIEFKTIRFFDNCLRPYVGLKEPSGASIKMEFAYDRRRLSPIYVYSETTKEYLEVPFANLTRPNISLWQLEAARKYLEEKSLPIDEEALFKAIDLADQVVRDSAERTKTARRQAEQARSRANKLKSEPAPLTAAKRSTGPHSESASESAPKNTPETDTPWGDIPDYSVED